jgi:hypothetical protein
MKKIKEQEKDKFEVEPQIPMTPREFDAMDVFGKYADLVPADVLRYMRKNPQMIVKRLYKMYGEKLYDYIEDAKSPKVVKLKESDLEKIVRKVIEEQKLPIRPGGTMQAFIRVENGNKFVYFESEMNPGKKTKYGPVLADHLKDKERFMAIEKNGKLIGKGKEIKKL